VDEQVRQEEGNETTAMLKKERRRQPLSKSLKLWDCHFCCCQRWKALKASTSHFLPSAAPFSILCVVVF